MEEIHSKLQEIRNPIHAIGVLIREMDYETDADVERGESSTAACLGWESSRSASVPVSRVPPLITVTLPFSSSPKYAPEPHPAVRQRHGCQRGLLGGM